MIRVQTPARLEFLGGGTDIHYFYNRSTGYVLNAAIDSYVNVVVNDISKSEVHFGKEGSDRIKAALEYFRITGGIEVSSHSNITTKGAGLGSSSSFTVALVHALSAHVKHHYSPIDLAETAAHIEIQILKEPIGKQDQYAAAIGGTNMLSFHAGGRVEVQPISLSPEVRARVHSHLLVFYTGITRSAADLLHAQTANAHKNFNHLKKMADLVRPGTDALTRGDLKSFAEILEQEWSIKKQLHKDISNAEIEHIYQQSKLAGAWGGRVSGAGGGGYMIVFAPPHAHQQICKMLHTYTRLPITLIDYGSRILASQ